jgi:hypothetical protein
LAVRGRNAKRAQMIAQPLKPENHAFPLCGGKCPLDKSRDRLRRSAAPAQRGPPDRRRHASAELLPGRDLTHQVDQARCSRGEPTRSNEGNEMPRGRESLRKRPTGALGAT